MVNHLGRIGCISLLLMIVGASPLPAQETPAAKLPPYPLDAVYDGSTIWIVDRNLPGVWKSVDGKLEVAIQGSKQFRQPLNAPRCIALGPDGQLFVGDSATREVYRIGSDGKPEPMTGGAIGIPADLAFGPDGTLYVADLETRFLWKLPKGGTAEKFLDCNPRGVSIDANGNLWIVSQGKDQLLKATPDGKLEVVNSGRPFSFPSQVAVDSQGNAFVADGYTKAIWKTAVGSAPDKVVDGQGLDHPVAVFWREDRLGIVDPRAAKIWGVAADGTLETWIAFPSP
ncbi:MAG: NHL repeat-containing protein [Pirellulaceae bacterium]|jgi:streptogramin lyase